MRNLFCWATVAIAAGMVGVRASAATAALHAPVLREDRVETYVGHALFEAREAADGVLWLVVTFDNAPTDGKPDVQFLAQAPRAVRPAAPWRGLAKVDFWQRGLRLLALDEPRAWDLVLIGEEASSRAPEGTKRIAARGVVKRSPASDQLPSSGATGPRASRAHDGSRGDSSGSDCDSNDVCRDAP